VFITYHSCLFNAVIWASSTLVLIGLVLIGCDWSTYLALGILEFFTELPF